MKSSFTFLKALFAVAVLPVAMALMGCPDTNPNEPDGNTLGATGTLYVNESLALYSYNLTTGVRVPLTFSGIEPCATPDKTIICIVAGTGLVEYNPSTKSSRVIVELSKSSSPHDDTFHVPQVSPDGKYVAYEGKDNKANIYIVDRNSGELLHTVTSYYFPSWTPDGRLVVTDYLSKKLFISDAVFTQFTEINTGSLFHYFPKASPDGKKVVFISGKHIYTANLDGTGLKQHTTADREESWPIWSPDSKMIAFIETVSSTHGIRIITLENGKEIDIEKINADFEKVKEYQFTWVN
jgi:Tol biopolymer transport system component